jgi:DNA-binding transcriptional regulator YhcF (GntR family)
MQLGILAGEYPPGSNMPSVRVLAMDAAVNPNTMQKALAELETRGLLFTKRTAGRFVTEDESVMKKLKDGLIRRQIFAFFDGMENLGIRKKEAMTLLLNFESENTNLKDSDTHTEKEANA